MDRPLNSFHYDSSVLYAINAFIKKLKHRLKRFYLNDLQLNGLIFENLSNKIIELTIEINETSDLKYLVEEFPLLEKLECVSNTPFPVNH